MASFPLPPLLSPLFPSFILAPSFLPLTATGLLILPYGEYDADKGNQTGVKTNEASLVRLGICRCRGTGQFPGSVRLKEEEKTQKKNKNKLHTAW